MLPPFSWTRTPSQWITLELIPNQPRDPGWSPEWGQASHVLKANIPSWLSCYGESRSQTPKIGCSRCGGKWYILSWGFKALVSNRSLESPLSKKAVWKLAGATASNNHQKSCCFLGGNYSSLCCVNQWFPFHLKIFLKITLSCPYWLKSNVTHIH